MLKIVSEQNIVGNARDLEKASIRRSLQTLMKGLRVMVIQFYSFSCLIKENTHLDVDVVIDRLQRTVNVSLYYLSAILHA